MARMGRIAGNGGRGQCRGRSQVFIKRQTSKFRRSSERKALRTFNNGADFVVTNERCTKGWAD